MDLKIMKTLHKFSRGSVTYLVLILAMNPYLETTPHKQMHACFTNYNDNRNFCLSVRETISPLVLYSSCSFVLLPDLCVN
jgi:hypothetical protein